MRTVLSMKNYCKVKIEKIALYLNNSLKKFGTNSYAFKHLNNVNKKRFKEYPDLDNIVGKKFINIYLEKCILVFVKILKMLDIL